MLTRSHGLHKAPQTQGPSDLGEGSILNSDHDAFGSHFLFLFLFHELWTLWSPVFDLCSEENPLFVSISSPAVVFLSRQLLFLIIYCLLLLCVYVCAGVSVCRWVYLGVRSTLQKLRKIFWKIFRDWNMPFPSLNIVLSELSGCFLIFLLLSAARWRIWREAPLLLQGLLAVPLMTV